MDSSRHGERSEEESSDLSDSWQSGISPDLDLDHATEDDEQANGEARQFDGADQHAPQILVQQCCRVLGNSWAFEEVVRKSSAPIPDDVQQSMAFWAFPREEKRIRIYATLGNPTPDFSKAEQLLRKGRLKKLYQVGFQLCARFSSDDKTQHKQANGSQSHNSNLQLTSIHFDRGCITSCSCTCESVVPWCSHVVAACLARVRYPDRTEIRPLLSTTLMQLDQVQLQKFSQYLIARAPGNLLFTAQELLDELLSPTSVINTQPGAPDTTAGGITGEQAMWLLDKSSMELILKEQATTLFSSDTSFLLTRLLPNSVPDVVETFQRLLVAASYHQTPAFQVDYLSMVASLLREGDLNAFTLLRSASWTLVDSIPENSPLLLAVQSLAYAMIADLAALWMQVALAFPDLGMQIVSSVMKFKTKLSKKRSISAYVHHLLDRPLAFVMHCTKGGNPRTEPESAPSSSVCALVEGESSGDGLRLHTTADLQRLTISSRNFGPGNLAAIIQKKLHAVLPPSAPILSPANRGLSDSQLGEMGPHALISILNYLNTHDTQDESKALAEAVATWVFRQRTDCVESSISPICQPNPQLVVSTDDHTAFLQLAMMVLQLLQKSVLSLMFALRVLLLPFSSQQAPLEVLVFKHEQALLDEIEAHLTTCGSVEEPLTTFAEEVASSLLSYSVTVEQGKTTPPYCAAIVVFSILTCGKEEGSLLFQLGHSMALHILRLNPITSTAIHCSSVSTLESDNQRQDILQFCIWKRFVALLLKVLLTCNACFGKEVTTMLEAAFPLPTDFETSARDGEVDKILSSEQKHTAATANNPLQPLLQAWEGGEWPQETEKPPPDSPPASPSPVMSTLAKKSRSVATGPAAMCIPVSLNLSVVYLLQEVANKLLKVKESTAGMEKLAALELYLLCLRTRNCSNPHWGLEHYNSEQISVDLSKLIVHVGEPALLILYQKWSSCLTPSCVVKGISVACFLPDSQKVSKDFSPHAICQVMKSVLQSVKYMDFDSIQEALQICCKGGRKHAAEVMDILMSKPSISSEVFFCLASNMLKVHQYLAKQKLKQSTTHGQDGHYLEQQPIVGENWEDSEETSAPPVPNSCSSISGMPDSKSVLGHFSSSSSVHALSTDLPSPTQQCRQLACSTALRYPEAANGNVHPTVHFTKKVRVHTLEFLNRAFRAGMRALEILVYERSEESQSYSHLKAPKYAPDIHTLLEIACSLGNQYILAFLQVLSSAVRSPHVLYETALAIAGHLSQNHPHQLTIQLQNQPLVGIVQDALQKFAKYIEQQAQISKTISCQKQLVEMIKEMKEMSVYLPSGDKELSNFLTTLVEGLKNKKLKQLIIENFQDYVQIKSRGGRHPKGTFAHQFETCANIDNSNSPPFEIACEMWDD